MVCVFHKVSFYLLVFLFISKTNHTSKISLLKVLSNSSALSYVPHSLLSCLSSMVLEVLWKLLYVWHVYDTNPSVLIFFTINKNFKQLNWNYKQNWTLNPVWWHTIIKVAIYQICGKVKLRKIQRQFCLKKILSSYELFTLSDINHILQTTKYINPIIFLKKT